jgi:hypothetical protein
MKYVVTAAGLGVAALLGNVAPRAFRADASLARELGEQRALLAAINDKLDCLPRGSSLAPAGVDRPAVDGAALKAELAATVREVLVAGRRDEEVAAKAAGVAPNSPEIYANADEWVNARLATKRWEAADFSELARLSVGLPDDQRNELRHRVLMAVNSGTFDTSRHE